MQSFGFWVSFLVNIRDETNLAVKEGCKVWDMGYKIGLNGVDNAALWFEKVRIPRTNLLNATSSMSETGVFSSKVHISSNIVYYSKTCTIHTLCPSDVALLD